MANKNYEPEVIQENTFPGEVAQPISSSQTGTGGNYSPNTSKERIFPKKRTAVELLSTALNTRSRKVLQEFELQQSGGFQIGNFQEGLTGDVRITPNGMTARDLAGNTTFALDGTTGDATFAGTLQAGTVIGGTIIAGGGSTVIDEFGINSENQFIVLNITSGTPQSTTSTSYVDVTGSSFTITTSRSINVLFTIFGYLKTDVGEFSQNGYQASLELYDSYLAGTSVGTLTSGGNCSLYITVDGGGNVTSQTTRTEAQATSISAINTVAAGTHDYKLRLKTSGGTGYLSSFSISLVVLGT